MSSEYEPGFELEFEFEFEDEDEDEPLPVNLHFRDERVLTVDIEAVMSSGRRMRRNRTVLAGAVAAAAVCVLGASAAYLAPASSRSTEVVSATPSTTSSQSFLDSALAGTGGHVTIISSRSNGKTGSTLDAVAWRAGPQICYGIANVTGSRKESSYYTCANRPYELSATVPTVLAPMVNSQSTVDPGTPVAIGFVSGDVAKVSVKVRGHTYDAAVVAVPGSPETGAYAVWIPAADHVTSSADFTQITGYDSRGDVVTG
ncbi:hypothetical protein KDK95_10380 [Actinospica sp. MGRD01-02]|uniref:Uncharacterized protein n=1 Tax=Actinospica acidithermotolerans TaxID=2828514 RepID=A0A941IFU1_9ACTN|nr:hypothetical protein [Actinospica acidithermotolerans]MBR7826710.1 hypothetical protein [Actinospica acidithermotolerans]